ncbi:MAG: serine/threonine-protein kinase [Patescibacteria group bacterium]
MATEGHGRVTGVHNVMTGTKLADRWQVLDVLGEGGMGVVYRGWDLRLGAPIAIKVLNPSLQGNPSIVKRFVEEVDTLKRSAHTNIATIHDFSAENEAGVVYLVMEFLDGPILKTVLDDSPGRRLHPQKILRIFTQILDALDAVHERGIIHRDLKPENVFVLRLGGGKRNTDVVKLIDFGIAKFRGGPPGTRPGLTLAGTVLGTPFYMSPEQCRGEVDVDQRTDIYAVGVMLYEAATGRLPFNKPTGAEIMTAHLNECPDAPCMINPGISPELEMVILRALAKNPEDRFQDAVEFSEALEAAIPEDSLFYRDSKRPSPVNGMAAITPPRTPTPTVLEDEQPTAEHSEPFPDLSKTPTRLLSRERPAAGLALAPTISSVDLETRRSAAGQAREAFDKAVVYLKQAEVWVLAPSRRVAVIATGITALVLVSLLVLAALLSGDGSAPTTGAKAQASAEAEIVLEEEIPSPRGDQPDVVVIQIPLPLPAPPTPTDVVQAPEEDAGEDVTANGEAETAAPEPPTPPSGYFELIETAKRARNRRVAVRKLEEATRLWPEGPDAWEALGDVLCLERGQTDRARNAFTRTLELLPPSALSRRALVEGKLRGLR